MPAPDRRMDDGGVPRSTFRLGGRYLDTVGHRVSEAGMADDICCSVGRELGSEDGVAAIAAVVEEE